jgi:hypothetical protein
MKLHAINLASYTKPQIIEQKNRDWVEYGADNNYYQYLIDRYNGSPTNNAIINAVSDLIYGKGIDATDSSKKPQEYAQMRSLIHGDCLQKVAGDLKLMGQAAFQVIYTKQGRQVAQVEHMPIQTIRAEKCNEEGDIEAYYHCADWTKLKPNEKPERYAAFGTSNDAIEILVIRPYKAGFYYYSPVDYQGGIPYAELEEEVANYHINNIKNGLSPSMMINFNNGVPDEEERMDIERKIRDKFSGSSNAGNFILAFNESKELAASIDAVPLSDAPQQYEFLSNEAMQKLMVSHRVTSPMLLGIKDNSGLGNNAEEIETATLLFDNTVIRPFQNLIISSIEQILAVNGINLDLYFKTLQPLEFTDRSAAVTKEETEKETGEKLSAQDCGCKKVSLASKQIDGRAAFDTKAEAELAAKEIGCEGYHTHELDGQTWYMPCDSHDIEELKDKDDPCWDGYVMIGHKMKDGKKVPNCVPEESLEANADSLLEFGEDEDLENWELVDERDVDYDQEEALDKMIGLASTGAARPNAKSEQDGSNAAGEQFRVRYQYSPLRAGANSRSFCKKMVSAKKIYRKEDIIRMETLSVNSGFGPNGSDNYSIWLYKGGARCNHKWVRKTYMWKDGVKPDVKSPNAETISTTKARGKGFRAPANDNKVSIAPNKMKNKGFINPPSDKDKQGGI